MPLLLDHKAMQCLGCLSVTAAASTWPTIPVISRPIGHPWSWHSLVEHRAPFITITSLASLPPPPLLTNLEVQHLPHTKPSSSNNSYMAWLYTVAVAPLWPAVQFVRSTGQCWELTPKTMLQQPWRGTLGCPRIEMLQNWLTVIVHHQRVCGQHRLGFLMHHWWRIRPLLAVVALSGQPKCLHCPHLTQLLVSKVLLLFVLLLFVTIESVVSIVINLFMFVCLLSFICWFLCSLRSYCVCYLLLLLSVMTCWCLYMYVCMYVCLCVCFVQLLSSCDDNEFFRHWQCIRYLSMSDSGYFVPSIQNTHRERLQPCPWSFSIHSSLKLSYHYHPWLPVTFVHCWKFLLTWHLKSLDWLRQSWTSYFDLVFFLRTYLQAVIYVIYKYIHHIHQLVSGPGDIVQWCRSWYEYVTESVSISVDVR